MAQHEWEAVIGLEVHCQLSTKTKIFSGANTAYGAEPNTQADAVTLGLPGVLPVLNGAALEMAIKFGLSVDAQIARRCVFARKHYFYPDLPKGYQISQYELPIVEHGVLDIEVNGATKRIGITRAHMEEDAGKSLHENFVGETGIDLNRAGTPLIEIVSEPDIRSSDEAVAYLKKLHQIVVYLGICDGNMQEGSFRCDANVSVRRKGTEKFGTRTETKNINSFRYVHAATDDEIERIRATLPELPEAKRDRFVAQYGLPVYDAGVLTGEGPLADYYETVVKDSGADPKLCANWIITDLLGGLNKAGHGIQDSVITAPMMAGLMKRMADNTLSGKLAKEVFEAMSDGEGDADAIIDRKGLRQITDDGAILAVIQQVMDANPGQLAQYREGKDKLFGFFVGQVMKASQGKANPDAVNRLLKTALAGE